MISGIKTVMSDMASKTSNRCPVKSEVAKVMLDYPDKQISRFDIGGVMLLIKNGRVMDPKSQLDQVADILIDNGRILRIAPDIEHDEAEQIDASGLVVAPGLVDIHVHFREPGQTHKEDIHTGALAAAAGGVTTVVMMANTNPVISDTETLQAVLASAAKEKLTFIPMLV